MRVSKKLPAIQKHIDTLERKGYSVRLLHTTGHLWTGTGDAHYIDVPKTVVSITPPSEDEPLCYGETYCSPSDCYDKAKGTQIAFQRALSELSFLYGRAALKKLLEPKEIS